MVPPRKSDVPCTTRCRSVRCSNLMNRYVNGLGVTADEGYLEVSGRRLADGGYARLKNLL